MSNRPRLILAPGLIAPGIVRNRETGRIFPCCYADCDKAGDKRIKIEVPHSQPRWRDRKTGRQEMVIYIFCSEPHRLEFAKGTPYERYV